MLLLLHVAAPHGSDPPRLFNVTLRYLPPSTTAHLQLLDAGIIAAFKAHYRKLYLLHLISQYDGKVPERKITLKDAVYFLVDAWKEVTSDTIKNCWHHTGILENGQRQVQPLEVAKALQNDVQVLIDQIDIAYAEKLSATEYISIDQSEPALDFVSDNEIVQLVNRKHNNDVNDTPDSDDEPNPPPMSVQAGKAALESTLRYCEEQDNEKIDLSFLAKLRALIRDASVRIQKEKKQLTLESFL